MQSNVSEGHASSRHSEGIVAGARSVPESERMQDEWTRAEEGQLDVSVFSRGESGRNPQALGREALSEQLEGTVSAVGEGHMVKHG
jgi:hypothetical protein